MTEGKLELELDNDFVFILSMIDDESIEAIKQQDPAAGKIAGRWLIKLCEEVVHGLAQKQIRNIYLTRLAECFASGHLSEPFKNNPPPGLLPALDPVDKLEKEPPWLKDLLREAKDKRQLGAAKDRRAYLQTKVLEGNRGACAYLAVSVADEGQVPHWIRMGTEKQYEKFMEDVFDRITKPLGEKDPPTGYGKEFIEYIIQAIDGELSGIVSPESNPQLEQILKKFMEFVKDKPLGKEAAKLSGIKLRQFLLVNLQSQLINEVYRENI